MKIRCWTPVLMLFFAYAANLQAADHTWDSEFDNTLFNTPEGWSKTQEAGAMQLTPPGLALGDQVKIVITPGGTLKADFATAFKEYRGLLHHAMKFSESPTQSATADEGYAVLYATEMVDLPDGTNHQWRFYLASNPGNRIEMVMLVASSEALFKQFTPTFEEFTKTVSYKTARPGAHATSAPSTQPDSK